MMDLLMYWLSGGQLVIPFPVTTTVFIQMKEEKMTKFKNSVKATKKEIKEALMTIAAESTPNRFNVKFDSDGSGACAILMVERDPGEDSNGRSPFEEWLNMPAKLMGWRVVFMHVPDKYIDVFYDADGNYKVTADA